MRCHDVVPENRITTPIEIDDPVVVQCIGCEETHQYRFMKHDLFSKIWSMVESRGDNAMVSHLLHLAAHNAFDH